MDYSYCRYLLAALLLVQVYKCTSAPTFGLNAADCVDQPYNEEFQYYSNDQDPMYGDYILQLQQLVEKTINVAMKVAQAAINKTQRELSYILRMFAQDSSSSMSTTTDTDFPQDFSFVTVVQATSSTGLQSPAPPITLPINIPITSEPKKQSITQITTPIPTKQNITLPTTPVPTTALSAKPSPMQTTTPVPTITNKTQAIGGFEDVNSTTALSEVASTTEAFATTTTEMSEESTTFFSTTTMTTEFTTNPMAIDVRMPGDPEQTFPSTKVTTMKVAVTQPTTVVSKASRNSTRSG